MLADARSALRTFLRNPRFAAIAVVALALGIGAATAMYSVVHAVLLRPLPYHDPARLAVLLERKAHAGSSFPTSPANYLDWKAQSRSFESIAAAHAWSWDLTGRNRPEQLPGLRVTPDLFPMLEVNPLLGRSFTSEDGVPGKDRVVILSHRLWMRRFGADPGIIGQTLTLDAEAYAVIGVMAASFRFPLFWFTGAELWAPVSFTAPAPRQARMLRVFGRLRPGVSLTEARTEMEGIGRRLELAYPEANTDVSVSVTGMHEMVTGRVQPALLVMLAAVGFLLLIACANVANLLLTRATGRQREIAVRLALGARRIRMVRQLLAESAVLGIAGGTLGLMLAFWGVSAFVAAVPERMRDMLPRREEIAIDLEVLAFTLVISLLTGILFGLVPALQASRLDLHGSLKEGVRVAGHRARLRNALAAAELASALILLAGAGLMLRSFQKISAIDPGFNARGVLTVSVSTTGTHYKEPGRRLEFYRQLFDRVRALPGVQTAGAINHLPLLGDVWTNGVAVEGRPETRPDRIPSAVVRASCPGYFAALGIRLLQGRDFDDHDDPNAPEVAIINQMMARRLWPGENPLGKRVNWLGHTGAWLTVVGVIRDVRQWDWASEPANEMYRPLAQDAGWRAMSLVIRTSQDPLALAGAVQNQIWSLDKDLPVSHVTSMERVVSNATWQPRFWMSLLAGFAGIALVLAAVGVYGVVSYAIGQRTREIGIRMALGAHRRNVLGLVLRQGAAIACVGALAGAAGAFALTHLMTSLLYNVSATDPAIFAMVALLLTAVALTAAAVPAWRAARIDPMEALRYE